MAVYDEVARGLLDKTVDPLRYCGQTDDRYGDHTQHSREAAKIITTLIPQGARVLDVGCGTGSISAMLKDFCQAEVLGLEPHPERAEVARSRDLAVLTSELSEAILPTLGLFDVVFFGDVLEHLPDPFSVLSIARQALKPGGCVLASVPNVAHWTVRYKLLRGRFDYTETGIMDATHLRWFTARTICQLFNQVDFQVVYQDVSAGLWLNEYSIWPLRWLRPRQRERFVLWGVSRWPTLFGCQHIIKAVPRVQI